MGVAGALGSGLSGGDEVGAGRRGRGRPGRSTALRPPETGGAVAAEALSFGAKLKKNGEENGGRNGPHSQPGGRRRGGAGAVHHRLSCRCARPLVAGGAPGQPGWWPRVQGPGVRPTLPKGRHRLAPAQWDLDRVPSTAGIFVFRSAPTCVHPCSRVKKPHFWFDPAHFACIRDAVGQIREVGASQIGGLRTCFSCNVQHVWADNP